MAARVVVADNKSSTGCCRRSLLEYCDQYHFNDLLLQMIGAVPPDYAATFFNVIDEDAALAAANAERAGSKQDSRAEEGGQETVHTVEEEPNALRRASMPFNCIDDSLQEMKLERCLYLADGATCRARMFCLILAKRAASDGGSMDSSLPAEL